MRRSGLLVEVPARRRGEGTSLPPLPEGPELTGTEAAPSPCHRFSLPCGCYCGRSPQGAGPGLTVSGPPSPLSARTPGLRVGWLPRELPRGWRTPSSPPVPAPTSPQTRGQEARPLGCRLSRPGSADDDPSYLILCHRVFFCMKTNLKMRKAKMPFNFTNEPTI